MKNVSCVVLDLDGTTLRSNGTLSERNKQAIVNAMEQGIHVIVASGRSYTALPDEVMNLQGIEYAIASNGANGYEVASGKRLFSHVIAEETVCQMLKELKEMDAVIELFIDGVPYADEAYVADPVRFGATKRAVPYVQRTRKPVEDIYAFAWENRMRLDSLDVIVSSLELQKQVRAKMEAIGNLYITSSVPSLVEMSNPLGGKAQGMQYFVEKLGLAREEIAAFGNAENDLDMMLYAGYGIAVANTPEEIRAQVPYVTLSNDEDGVAAWLEEYVLR